MMCTDEREETTKTLCEFALHFDEVGPSLINIWPLRLENVIKRLCLQAALRDGKVDEGRSTADIWSEGG